MHVSTVHRFPRGRAKVPPRDPHLAPHQMLCGLFDDQTPVMDFLKDLYQLHGILTVRDWDRAGGSHLFDKHKLNAAARRQFNARVGAPLRPATVRASSVVAFRREN